MKIDIEGALTAREEQIIQSVLVVYYTMLTYTGAVPEHADRVMKLRELAAASFPDLRVSVVIE